MVDYDGRVILEGWDMKWEVSGADRQTGQDKTIFIEADNEDSARRRGNRAGLMVADCRAVDPNDSGAAVQVIPPTLNYHSPQIAPAPVIQQIIVDVPRPRYSPGLAAFLSFIFPGLGQMYKGQPINGVAWLVITLIGYMFFVLPGLVLHLCCILGAAMGDPYKR